MHSFVNIQIPNCVKEQLIEEFYKLPRGYEVYIRNEWIDRNIIAAHSTILENLYGYHSTSYDNNTTTNIAHTDPRPCALNFGLLNCTPDTNTLFFIDCNKSKSVTFKNNNNDTRVTYYFDNGAETSRVALLNGKCMLLNTHIAHKVENFLPPDRKRIVLSIDCKVSYDEAVNYFNSLGLIE